MLWYFQVKDNELELPARLALSVKDMNLNTFQRLSTLEITLKSQPVLGREKAKKKWQQLVVSSLVVLYLKSCMIVTIIVSKMIVDIHLIFPVDRSNIPRRATLCNKIDIRSLFIILNVNCDTRKSRDHNIILLILEFVSR